MTLKFILFSFILSFFFCWRASFTDERCGKSILKLFPLRAKNEITEREQKCIHWERKVRRGASLKQFLTTFSQDATKNGIFLLQRKKKKLTSCPFMSTTLFTQASSQRNIIIRDTTTIVSYWASAAGQHAPDNDGERGERLDRARRLWALSKNRFTLLLPVRHLLHSISYIYRSRKFILILILLIFPRESRLIRLAAPRV